MRIFKKFNIKLPLQRTEQQEFGKGRQELIMCEKCDAVYYKKSWHHGFSEFRRSAEKDIPIKFVLCPACEMIKNRQYEGRIIISNVSAKFASQLVRTIEKFCHRAYEEDPLDRLIEIRKSGSSYTATTTENELAVRLAKKIKEVFDAKKTKVKIIYSSQPSDVSEIRVDFS